ncbi:hypothetical protein SAMN05192560_0784 [Methylobacillus rhizosphaerae]|uniref:Uncharacterized protein n=1 Tax=Methylobacillus rhizosphaerae TaxID=551994 RepID=A0A238YT25_9PROT|nr:hypothetical protein [Methylobacillus rhizosphaerae]SNR73824.1 hypothetical protein SAMN05192560_0784 [Methylobacillus rhizosphaerae]
MPRVPTYDSFQATPDILPQVRISTPELPDIAGQQTQQMARGMMQSGGELSKVALDMQREVDDSINTEGMNDLMKSSTDLELSALQLQGKNALDRPDGKSLPDEFVEQLNNRATEIESNMKTDNQKKRFRMEANQVSQQLYGKLSKHMVQQQKVYQVEGIQSRIETAQNRASLLYGDAEAVAQSQNAISASVDELLNMQGLAGDKDIREARMMEALTPLHAGVINGLADSGRVDLAKEYYDKNSATMSLQARSNAMKVLEEGQREARGQAYTEQFLSEAGGDVSKALALAREKLSGKDEDDVVSRIKNIDAERVTLRERAQKDAADQAWQLLAAGRRIPPSLYASMDGRDVATIRQHIANGSPQRTDVSKWLEFVNKTPAEMEAMDPVTLLRDYRQYFSDSDIRQADEMIRGIKSKDVTGLQVYTTQDLMNRTARELGILPQSGTKTTKAQDSQYLEFAQRMQDKIKIHEATTGKKATQDDLSRLLQEEKKNIVFVDEWGSDPQKAVIAITPNDQAKTYVNIGNEEIYTSSIPTEQRITIIRKLQQRNMPVTEQAIADYWVRAGKPK